MAFHFVTAKQRFQLFCATSLLMMSAKLVPALEYVHVSNNSRGFVLDQKPYHFKGINFWEGVWLAMPDESGGNRSRLHYELDTLASMGLNGIRILGSSLGPNSEPYRWKPALFPEPSKHDETVFKGLDYLLYSLSKRNMKAIISLSDFWQDSGGFAQYAYWADPSQKIPYPPSFPDFTGSWPEFIAYASRLYCDKSVMKPAQAMLESHIKTIIQRVNHVNGRHYSEDDTIFSWEITNEPQDPPRWWIDRIGHYIKSLDQNHLLTSGLEGKGNDSGRLFIRTHSSPYVDFATVHLWVENWGIYQPYNGISANLNAAKEYATEFLKRHAGYMHLLKKPLILEEFGLARDGWKKQEWTTPSSSNRYSPDAATSFRDEYFNHVYAAVHAKGSSFSGIAPWAWSGQGRPTDSGPRRLGDPPHETPGWYSIYDQDSSTIHIISNYSRDAVE